MKKLIITLFVSILCLTIQAQSFKAGIFGGIVPSQVDGDDQGGFNKLGFTAGVFINKELKTGKLQGELAFTTKGSRPSNNAATMPMKLSFSYIDISIYYSIGIWNNLSARAGLVPSVLIYGSESMSGVVANSGDDSFPYRRFSTEISAGLDYAFTKHWSIGATYNYSIFSIRKGDLRFFGIRPSETNGQYNNYIKIFLSYQF
ncbi:MAG: PorT family protein [Bacteroidales bacterium]|jgi:opacity protein-like surface antigen|nr:PorT family protein [Bacteroidales bacterium]